jgi:hypothetical protein
MGDPYVREVGRVADSQGFELIVGVNYDAVTLQTPAGPAVELGETLTEELAQLLVAATWQAAWQTAVSLARAATGTAP